MNDDGLARCGTCDLLLVDHHQNPRGDLIHPRGGQVCEYGSQEAKAFAEEQERIAGSGLLDRERL